MKALLIVVLVLAVAARTELKFTVAGAPVAMPVLWLIAAGLVLIIAAAVLHLVRSIVRDWPPRMVTA